MKFILETADIPDDKVKDFAIFCGWSEKILTTSESPNFEIDNPVSFVEFIKNRFGTPIKNEIKTWNLREAQKIANEKIALANEELKAEESIAEEHANQIISISTLGS